MQEPADRAECLLHQFATAYSSQSNLESLLHEVYMVIVDPYSSGAMLAEALLARGAECIAVESSPEMPEQMKSGFNPDMFQCVIQHDGNYKQTLHAVRRYRPAYVVAGSESGVELAENLAGELELPSNGTSLRDARRDKYLMARAVRGKGLRTAQQFRSDNIEAIINWTQNSLDWPVIVKPPKSVASDHVICCRSIEEVRKAAKKILSA